jgi:ABC-2 type transport system permease protein
MTAWPIALTAVYRAQLGRARVGGGAVVIVATVQSLAIVALLRGMGTGASHQARAAVVSGATLSVVAFIAINLLAQRFAGLKAGGGLDYYGTLPVHPAAVVLGLCGSYATFALPGVVAAAVTGTTAFGLPAARLWMLVPVTLTSAVSFSGLGALGGLMPSRAEIATLAGQFGLTAVMLLGVIPPQSLPPDFRAVRAVLPLTWDIDAFADALTDHPDWSAIALRLAGSALFGACCLAAAARASLTAINRLNR